MTLDSTHTGLANPNEKITLMKLELRPSLEGITLKAIVTCLSEDIGWEAMAAHVAVRCFTNDPSINSSLKFLRKTPWAREKLEQLYLQHVRALADNASTNAKGGIDD